MLVSEEVVKFFVADLPIDYKMALRDNNPFRDDEDDDDFELIRDSELARVRAQKQFYQNRTLDSTERSVRAIQESEALAVETEVELARQGEALDRTEKNLDTMQGQLKLADRHVTSMKSLWGTFTNYFRKAPTTETEIKAKASSQSKGAVNVEKDIQTTAYDRRYGDTARLEGVPNLVTNQRQDYEIALDRNLDDISTGLSALKHHALALGDTIEQHNDQIIRITEKAGNLDKNVDNTNKRIRKILN